MAIFFGYTAPCQNQNKMYLVLSYRALLEFDGLYFRIYAPLFNLLLKTNIIRRFEKYIW